jgi:hypothetical protein
MRDFTVQRHPVQGWPSKVLNKVLIRREMSTLEKPAIFSKVLMESQGAHRDVSTLEESERLPGPAPTCERVIVFFDGC